MWCRPDRPAGAAEQVREARVPGWRGSGGRDEEGVRRCGGGEMGSGCRGEEAKLGEN